MLQTNTPSKVAVIDNFERFCNLEQPEQNKLRAITTTDEIVSVEVGSDWEDDHEMCMEVTLNGVQVEFWWIGIETAAAFFFASSEEFVGKCEAQRCG